MKSKCQIPWQVLLKDVISDSYDPELINLKSVCKKHEVLCNRALRRLWQSILYRELCSLVHSDNVHNHFTRITVHIHHNNAAYSSVIDLLCAHVFSVDYVVNSWSTDRYAYLNAWPWKAWIDNIATRDVKTRFFPKPVTVCLKSVWNRSSNFSYL